MVNVIFDEHLQRAISKIKDQEVKKSIKNKINKITNNPDIGKPMRNTRKGTREVYVESFRLSYAYYKDKDMIEFLDFYHKDEQ